MAVPPEGPAGHGAAIVHLSRAQDRLELGLNTLVPAHGMRSGRHVALAIRLSSLPAGINRS